MHRQLESRDFVKNENRNNHQPGQSGYWQQRRQQVDEALEAGAKKFNTNL